jgi:hypothetical protein
LEGTQLVRERHLPSARPGGSERTPMAVERGVASAFGPDRAAIRVTVNGPCDEGSFTPAGMREIHRLARG